MRQVTYVVLLMGLITLLSVGCTTSPKNYPATSSSLALPLSDSATYIIQDGDVLEIKFPHTESHNEEVMVRSDGYITSAVAGQIKAVGLTPEEMAEEIKKSSSHRLRNPKVAVTVKQSVQKVYVGGEVETAGVVPYKRGLTALQAIMERGGFLNTADWEKILLVRMEGEKTTISEVDFDQIATRHLAVDDVIFVPKTGIAKANLAVKQYIRDLLPIYPTYGLP